MSHFRTVSCICSSTWRSCHLSQRFQTCLLIKHNFSQFLSYRMQTFLLLIFTFYIFQFSKFEFKIVNIFMELFFKIFHDFVSTFFKKLYFVFFHQKFNIINFVGHNETKSGTLRSNSGCSSHSIDIFLNITAQVILNNPGNFFEIESSWCHISTNEHRSCSSLFKSKKILFSFFMFHLTM